MQLYVLAATIGLQEQRPLLPTHIPKFTHSERANYTQLALTGFFCL